MSSVAFKSIEPHSYNEKIPTQSSNKRHQQQLPATLTSQHETRHGYTALTTTSTPTAESKTSNAITLTVATWTQFGLRIAQLCVAIGLLACTCLVTNLPIEQDYALRAPTCIDILTTFYAIYRLCVAAYDRRTSLTTNHHFFTLIVDGILLPFYIFIALFVRGATGEATASGYVWSSIFQTTEATKHLILAIWSLAIIVAVVHALSFMISCGLFIVSYRTSRKEAADQVLDSRLTARPNRNRHNASQNSQQGVTDEKNAPGASMQTTLNGKIRLSPHNPKSVVSESRLNLSLPALPVGTRALRPGSPSKSSMLFTSHAGSSVQSFSGSSFYSDVEGAPPLPRKSSKRRSELSPEMVSPGTNRSSVVSDLSMDPDGSVVADDLPRAISPLQPLVPRVSSSISAFDFALARPHLSMTYQAVPQNSPDTSAEHLTPQTIQSSSHGEHLLKDNDMQPLHMNPPTPPTISKPFEPLNNISPNPISTKPSKRRFYGDLIGSFKFSTHGSNHSEAVSTTQEDRNGRVVSTSGIDIVDAERMIDVDTTYGDVVDDDETSYKGAGGVLRTGLRGRIVSGKAAEEGRASKFSEGLANTSEPSSFTRHEWGAAGTWFGKK